MLWRGERLAKAIPYMRRWRIKVYPIMVGPPWGISLGLPANEGFLFAVGGGGSCSGLCGGSAGSCFCDASCVTYGDCCPDACSACGVCGKGALEAVAVEATPRPAGISRFGRPLVRAQ